MQDLRMEQISHVNYPQLLAQLSDEFFPIFISLLIVILIGYLAGRFNALPAGRGKSVLASFIFNIALPAGILFNMYKVPVSGLPAPESFLSNFVFGILIVKTLIYITVVGVGMFLVRRTALNWATVFLFALAAIHSNDFGIGKPLLDALFRNATTPRTREFPRYMENSMMITYMTYVPLTLFFLELRKNREISLSWGKSFCYALIRSLLRPVVLAVIMGFVIRAAFGEFQPDKELPVRFRKWFWDSTLNTLRMTISPIYLILTGLALVGGARQFTNLKQIMAIVAVALLKLGVSPLVLKLTQIFIPSDPHSKDLPIMFYLYGTLPTSPIVVVFASLYDLMPQTLALIVISTTVSFAPIAIFYLSLYYVSWCQLFSEETALTVNTIAEGIGFSAVTISAWTLFILLFLSKYRSVLHRLLLGQILCLILYSSLTASISIEKVKVEYAQMVALGKAVAATTFCTLGCTQLLIVGVVDRGNTLVINTMKSTRSVLLYIGLGIIAPVGVLALTSLLPHNPKPIHKHNYVWDMSDNISDEFVISKMILFIGGIVLSMLPRFASFCQSPLERGNTLDRLRYQPIEDTSEGSTGLRDYHRARMGRKPTVTDSWDVSQDDSTKFQFVGFMSVMMAMISLMVEVWALIGKTTKASKSFVGLVILYQNMWLFVALALGVLFGTSVSEIRDRVVSIKDFIVRCMMTEEDAAPLPQLENLPAHTLMTCNRFIKYHLTACLSAIARSVEGTFGTVQEDVFSGEDMVTWLINVGLADDREDAVEYASKLVSGRVVAHIDKRRSFYDNEYLYRFTKVNLPRRENIDAAADDLSDEFQMSHNGGNMPDWF